MKENIAKMWVKALRSGEYKQVKNTLCGVRKDGDVGFCCLGVLTDLYMKDRKAKKKGCEFDLVRLEPCYDSLTESTPLWEADGCNGQLPLAVAKWAGFNVDKHNWETGDYGDDNDIDLASLNDGCKTKKVNPRNFKQIASTIEKNWENI
jgi:hypothetical protein